MTSRRLVERLVARYGRFFDAIRGAALYFEAPLRQLRRRRDKHPPAVLKDNTPPPCSPTRRRCSEASPTFETDDERRRKKTNARKPPRAHQRSQVAEMRNCFVGTIVLPAAAAA